MILCRTLASGRLRLEHFQLLAYGRVMILCRTLASGRLLLKTRDAFLDRRVVRFACYLLELHVAFELTMACHQLPCVLPPRLPLACDELLHGVVILFARKLLAAHDLSQLQDV